MMHVTRFYSYKISVLRKSYETLELEKIEILRNLKFLIKITFKKVGFLRSDLPLDCLFVAVFIYLQLCIQNRFHIFLLHGFLLM